MIENFNLPPAIFVKKAKKFHQLPRFFLDLWKKKKKKGMLRCTIVYDILKIFILQGIIESYLFYLKKEKKG